MTDLTETSTLIIRYDPRSPASIEAGLAGCRHYLSSENAFSDGFCQISFEVLPGCDDTIGMLSRIWPGPVVFDYYRLTEALTRPNALLSETGLSPDTVFFLRACLFPELQAALTETGKTICRVARQMNDASRMRISEQEVFGAMPLLMMSLCYPRSAWLLGSFIVPYWPGESLRYVEKLPALLVEYLGYTRDMLKLFCYCDNPNARARMFSPETFRRYESRAGLAEQFDPQTPLLDIFRQKPEELAAFKSMLRKRFARQPCLQDDDPRYVFENPLESVLLSVLYPHQDDELLLTGELPEQTLDTVLIDCTAREVAASLKADIEQYLGHSVGFTPPAAEDGYHPDHYVCGTGVQQWKSLIIDGFSQGDQVWAYIETGQYPDIPHGVEACDLRAVASQGNFTLSQTIEYYVGPYDSLNSEIVPVMQALLDDWGGDDLVDEGRLQNRQKLLRLLDVIHRWNGGLPFPAELMNLIVDEYQALSEAEFLSRYHGDWVHYLLRLINDINDYRGMIEAAHFSRCYTLICAWRAEAADVILQLTEDDSRSRATVAAVLAGIVSYDKSCGRDDQLTRLACDYLHQHLPALLLQQLADYSEFPASEATLKESDSLPVAEDYRQLMSWLAGEHENQSDVLDRVNSRLSRESREYSVSDTQIYYQFLNDFEEDSQKLLVCALVIADCPESPVSGWCSRFLSLWLNLAPGKVCRMLGYFWLEKTLPVEEKITGIEVLTARLTRHGLPRVAATAYLLESVIDALDQDDDIRQVLAPFFERYLKEQADEMNACIEPALKLIKPLREQVFYMALCDANPGLKICYFDQALLQLLSRCLYQRMMETVAETERLPVQAHDDLEHFIRLMELPVLLSFRQTAELLDLCDHYQLDDFDTPYGQTELAALLWYASPCLRMNVLRLHAARPSLGLDRCFNEDKISPEDFCSVLADCDIRPDDLLALIRDFQWSQCLPWFAARFDIHPLMEKLPLDERLEILRALASEARKQDSHAGYPDELPGKVNNARPEAE